MKSVIEVKNISKVYNIGHEQMAVAGTGTFRDTLTQVVRKPIELFTGHKMQQEKFWALKDVSFNVEPGDVLGIIGRNGSGKSTLLKILSRIVEPTSGEIRMLGKVASLLEVGTGFHPELTGRENIYFNGAILGMSQGEIRRKFNDIIEFSEVEKFLDTPVKFYSSGMYVRLAFAVAAHLEPDILIVDEVLAVGDLAFQKKCLGKMQSVAKEGRTVLFVSHSMPTVQRLCTKGIHLVEGEIMMQGSAKEAVDNYLNIHLSTRPRFDLPNQTNGGAGRATTIEIFDSNGIPSSSIPFGVGWKIRATFEIKSDISSFVLGLGLKNNLDVAVWTMWTKPQLIKTGHYSASFDLDNIILESGIYNIAIGLSEEGRTFYYSDGDAFFNIDDQGKVLNNIIQTSGAGIILNPVKTSLEKLS